MKTKKLLAVVLSVIMLLSSAPLGGLVGLDLPDLFKTEASAEEYEYNGFYYRIIEGDEDDEVKITGCSNSISGALTIPSTIEGYPVTSIGNSAFEECTKLTSVEIPDSVTSIGESAFYYCTSLTSVKIPDSVTSIGLGAFEWCTSLTSVTIGNSVKSIGDYAFARCESLTSVEIPDSVTSIGYGAFVYCRSLTSVTIPDSVTRIGDSAFQYCSSLSSVTILSKDCDISLGSGTFFQTAIIYGFHSSTAQNYATVNRRKFVPLDDHTLKTEFELPATCSAYGFKTIACEFCDYKANEIIEPFGHTDTDEDNKCDYCKISLATSVCDHDSEIDYTAPTCTEDGKIVIKCKTCTKTSEKIIEKLGHNYVDFVIEPTCTSDGYTKHYCVNCGDEKHDTPVKAPGHSMRTETIKPTCTENGCDVVICENCGYNYEANEVKAVGHSYKVVSEERYCFAEGEIVYKCDACGESYDEVAPLIPHTDENNDNICDVCKTVISPEKNCSHLCHKDGFLGFIWKFINFFNKLFKINQYCECGAQHW